MERSSGEDSVLFDASQYAFFGEGSVNEVDLEEEEDDDDDALVIGGRFVAGDELNEYHLFQKDEVSGVGSLSDIDDLATTFAKLNKVVSGPKHPGVIGDRGSGSFSRESSSAAEWVREAADFPDWIDHHMSDSECYEGNKRWSSQPHLSSMHLPESKTIYRTSSYPEQQQQPPPLPLLPPLQHYNSEPIFGPNSSLTSFPPAGSPHPSSNYNSHLLKMASLSAGLQSTFSAPNCSPLSGSGLHLAGLAHGLYYNTNLPHLTSSSIPHHNQWSSHAGVLHAGHSLLLNNILLHQYQNGLLPSQLISTQQQRGGLMPFQPSLAVQSQIYNTFPSPAHLSKCGATNNRESKSKSSQKGKHSVRFAHQGSDAISHKIESNLEQIRSKYMTAEEIESILKLQHAATHGNDPYVDDYYHQACLSKKTTKTGLNYRFCPSDQKEQSSRSRNSTDSQPHLYIDARGRVCFSSVRRPHPLLEVEPPPSACGDGKTDQKSSDKPLEQEPMLAARFTVEDGLCLLLNVDDIDRLLQLTQPQDGGSQLRQKRHVLLEGLAASLQLVDPLRKSGNSIGLSQNDDIVFLRIVSFSKGRKLISKFLQLISPGSELSRIVSMAIFRHLRFVFGGRPSEPEAANTVDDLAKAVCLSIYNMDLNSLGACLVAVVCSSEQPPLRPLGSPVGDGASVILKCVLESGSNLLRDTQFSQSFDHPKQTFWQASFDAFFGLLMKYCLNKYDNIVQSLVAQNVPNTEGVGAEAARAVRREIPVELLRTCLPHTDDSQKKLLLNFAQQCMPVTGFNAHGGGNGQIDPESVQR